MTDLQTNTSATAAPPASPHPSTSLVAVSYSRVSTKEQAEKEGSTDGYSLPAQRDANARKATSLGAKIVAEFIDRGESARSADRPELQRMLQFIAQGGVDLVIVHKVDRLARNRADDVAITLAIKQAGCRLISVSENIDETPSGMLLHGIMSSIAEFYSRNLATEVMKGMSQKAMAGGTPGKAPIGYLNRASVDDDGREVRTVVLDPLRAEMVRTAFERYASGEVTVRDLATELADRGFTSLPTPSRAARPITAGLLHKILVNPYYKGVVTFQGSEYPGRHKPLVSDALWQRVQDALALRVVGEKTRKHPFYLKSTVFCARCGSRLIVHKTTNRSGTTYEYLLCTGRHERRNDCQQRSLPMQAVEDQIVELYARFELSEHERSHVKTALKHHLQVETAAVRQARDQLSRERDRLAARQKKLLDSHLDGLIPTELYRSEQQMVSRKLAGLEEKLTAHAADDAEFERRLNGLIELASKCHQLYARASDSMRRRLNQAFFKRILVDTDDDPDGEPSDAFEIIFAVTDAVKAQVQKTTDAVVASVARCLSQIKMVPLEGLEPPTLSLGRNCSSIELQRLMRCPV